MNSVRWLGTALQVLCGVVAVFAGTAPAVAQEVTVLCNFEVDWCEALKTTYEKTTGQKAVFIRRTDGESLAQIRAEKSNPRADVYHAAESASAKQLAAEGLLEAYKSPQVANLHDWAQRIAEENKYFQTPIYTGVLGWGYNTELLAKKKLPEPKCWKDLANPVYKDEIQMANPNASGTAYATVATLVQIFGEDKAFEMLKAWHRNINNYPRSGVGPVRAVGRGETGIAVTFLHDGQTEIANGFPVKILVPCEGTGYEVGSMSIVKGARNLDNARKFYDWALTPAAQKIGAETKNFQVPSNKAAPAPPGAPKMDEIKLINYDFAKYGSAAERKRLLEKWDKEVYAVPR